MLQWLEDLILAAAGHPWALPLTALLCLLDGLIPVFPSESVLVALGSIVRDGEPFPLWALWLAGFVGAFLGDVTAYCVGRVVGTERFRWMRCGRVRGTVEVARRHLRSHGALLLFTARFIPGGRVAVNLTAGAVRYPPGRFVALDLVATMLWSAYSIAIARLTAGWLHNPVLQIALAVTGAALVGLVLDRVLKAVLRRRLARDPGGLAPEEEAALR
ncbi:DedA family protein [Micrococcus sp.]|uniref:DedA family protein n=1 Tax=Micrococcus sp. TaxID=1271 RepID=UPI002A9110D0|nr:DedA family protein [Micrococcus sp.]MDY6055376.1 DedA family protein [Micrococcus sp.]